MVVKIAQELLLGAGGRRGKRKVIGLAGAFVVQIVEEHGKDL